MKYFKMFTLGGVMCFSGGIIFLSNYPIVGMFVLLCGMFTSTIALELNNIEKSNDESKQV